MRIGAGRFKGIPLATLKGEQTRPTSDKIRGSFFQMVGPFFEGGRILDAFAGSGAIGLEALSRGMSEAVLVEHHPKAAQVIEENIRKVKTRQAKLHRGDVRRLWPHLKGPFNLIYLDPPYRMADIAADLEAIRQANLLTDQGLVCYEVAYPFDVPDCLLGYELIKLKTYKASQIAFYRVQKELEKIESQKGEGR